METVFFIIAKSISITLGVASFAMLLRVVLQFFVDPMESRIFALVCLITEPFIVPVRAFMVKFNIAQDSPIDWAFSITYILIFLLRSFLPVI